jgi:hypothetical protein
MTITDMQGKDELKAKNEYMIQKLCKRVSDIVTSMQSLGISLQDINEDQAMMNLYIPTASLINLEILIRYLESWKNTLSKLNLQPIFRYLVYEDTYTTRVISLTGLKQLDPVKVNSDTSDTNEKVNLPIPVFGINITDNNVDFNKARISFDKSSKSFIKDLSTLIKYYNIRLCDILSYTGIYSDISGYFDLLIDKLSNDKSLVIDTSNLYNSAFTYIGISPEQFHNKKLYTQRDALNHKLTIINKYLEIYYINRLNEMPSISEGDIKRHKEVLEYCKNMISGAEALEETLEQSYDCDCSNINTDIQELLKRLPDTKIEIPDKVKEIHENRLFIHLLASIKYNIKITNTPNDKIITELEESITEFKESLTSYISDEKVKRFIKKTNLTKLEDKAAILGLESYMSDDYELYKGDWKINGTKYIAIINELIDVIDIIHKWRTKLKMAGISVTMKYDTGIYNDYSIRVFRITDISDSMGYDMRETVIKLPQIDESNHITLLIDKVECDLDTSTMCTTYFPPYNLAELLNRLENSLKHKLHNSEKSTTIHMGKICELVRNMIKSSQVCIRKEKTQWYELTYLYHIKSVMQDNVNVIINLLNLKNYVDLSKRIQPKPKCEPGSLKDLLYLDVCESKLTTVGNYSTDISIEIRTILGMLNNAIVTTDGYFSNNGSTICLSNLVKYKYFYKIEVQCLLDIVDMIENLDMYELNDHAESILLFEIKERIGLVPEQFDKFYRKDFVYDESSTE